MARVPFDPATTSTETLDLRAFCLVVDLGSITAAARALGETKGSVSRRISRLEQAVSAVLLRRSPRLVQPTEDGLAYRARVGRALELLDEAHAQLHHARLTPEGHLRVTAPIDVALGIAPPILVEFSRKFPKVTVEVIMTEALLDFDAHQIDLALRAGSALRDSALVAHKLEDVAVRLFASPDYVRQRGAPRRPEDLADHPLLLTFAATRGAATLSLWPDGGQEAVSVRVRAALSASDFSFTKEAAILGAGVAMLPVNVVRRDVERRRLVPLLEGWSGMSAALYLLHHGTRFLPPKVRAFRDHVLEFFRKDG